MSDIFNYNKDNKGDKRTLIAVVLSVIVITVGFMIQGALFPPAPAPAPAAPQAAQAAAPAAASTALPSAPASGIVAATAAPAAGSAGGAPAVAVDAPASERSYTIETDLVVARISNAGGDLVSLKLKGHKDKDGLVDLVVPGGPVNGLSVAFGGPETAPLRDLMNARYIDEKTIEFSRVYLASVPGKAEPVPFTFKKTYSFRNGDHMFGLAIGFENSANEYLPLDRNGSAYTLSYGPRIGPSYAHLSKNADFRKIITLQEGKKKEERSKTATWNPKAQPAWSAIAGKYFALVIVPELPAYTATYGLGAVGSPDQTASVAMTRPAIKASRQTDAYYVYFGPKNNKELSKYDYADRNAFGRQGLQLESVLDQSNLFGWLEKGLKWAMNLFYGIIPNYGVSIILVTLLVKVLLFPLSKKGSVSTARMQELQPKMQEIQAKYKSNPQKLNQEMAEFYKRENYNPMSGCLPLLIQFPLFIAMYNLFNNHFDLRGASFIAGWVPDLSMPESILNFGNFRVPILGWNDLRALPIIYLASQLLYGKFTQTPTTGPQASQMKLMMYGMPIMFFFILYDVPSGLLIYWIASNVLQIVQQIAINDYLRKHKESRALAAAAAAGPAAGKKGKGPKA